MDARARGTALVALSCTFFAGMATLTRSLSAELSFAQLVVLRFGVGLLVAAGFYGAQRRLPRPARPWLWTLRGLLGGTSVFLYFLTISKLQVGPATLLNYTSPCYAALFAAWFLGERPKARTWIGILVATVGAATVLLTTVDHERPFAVGLGAWAGVLSAAFGGAAMTTIRSLRRDTDALTVFLSFCVFGFLIALPVAIPLWRPMGGKLWLAAVAMGLLAAAAQLIFTYAFKFVTAAAGSAASQLTPIFSWMLGVMFLGEEVAGLAIVGACLCVGGVIFGASTRAGFAPSQLPKQALAPSRESLS